MSYAPWWRRPLMKNVGVPDTRLRSAPSTSWAIRFAPTCSCSSSVTRATSSPSRSAYDQIGHLQLVLVLEQLVVHLPERALVGCGLRGQCRQLGVRMYVWERQVAPHVADVCEVAEQLAHSGLRPSAVRA